MPYAIRFDFPETDAPLYAGRHKGALGWAPTLATALIVETADEAARWLANGYGAARIHGRVIHVTDGGPATAAVGD